jgi:excisionase family DNA binding protein
MASMLNKALRGTSIDNLRLLPAGRTPMDPGALLNSSKFKALLDLLKTQADFIIIDSGPLLKVVETKAIANVVDGTVLVVSNSQTRLKTVQQAVEYFKNKPHNNLLGLVFNRIKSAHGDYHVKSAAQAKLRPARRSQQADRATLTLAEVTDYLGVSEETVRRWCEQGRLPATKHGRRWSVRLEDLNEFIGAYHGAGEVQGDLIETPALVESDTLASSKAANGQERLEAETATTQRRAAKSKQVSS